MEGDDGIYPHSDNSGNGRLDTSASDLLEQQQAMEQARLLQRFRELRQWQLQQQEQLMNQQKTQLELLRQEQLKVQSLLTKERETQWGGGGKVIRHHPSQTPTKTPPRRRPPIPTSNHVAPPSMTGSQDPLAVTQSQSSLPMPVMYGSPDPQIDDTSTNSELFSNPGSHMDYQEEMISVDEGVAPIPDTASEISDGSYLQFSRKKNFLHTQPFLGDMASDNMSVKSDGSYIPLAPKQSHPNAPRYRSPVTEETESSEAVTLLHTLLQTTKADTLKQLLGLVSPEKVPLTDLPRSLRPRAFDGEDLNVNENCSAREGTRPLKVNGASPKQGREVQMTNGVSVPQNGDVRLVGKRSQKLLQSNLQNHYFDSESHVRSNEHRNGIHGNQMKMNGLEDHYEDEVNDSQLDESDMAEITVEEAKNERVLGIDDRPIKPPEGGKRTFEQMLEEQIRQEEEKLRAGTSSSPSVKKKPFLRKGQGLARFTNGKKKTPPKQTSVAERHFESKQQPEPKPLSKPKESKSNQNQKKTAAEPRVQKPTKDSKLVTQVSPRSKSQAKSQVKPKISPRSPPQSPQKHRSQVRTDSPPVPALAKQKRKESDGDDLPFADDASFVSKIKRIEQEKKLEEDELEVFELLEDFADNVSFCSNSSVVSRLLQQRAKDDHTMKVDGIKAVIEAKKAEKEKTTTTLNTNKNSSENPNYSEHSPRLKDMSLIDAVDFDSSDTITDSSSSSSSSGDEEEKSVHTPRQKRDISDSDDDSDTTFEQSQLEGFVLVNKNSDREVRTSVPISPSKSITRKIATKDPVIGDSSDMQSILKRLKASADEPDIVKESGKSMSTTESQTVVNQMFEGKKVTTGMQHGQVSSDDSDSSEDSETKEKQLSARSGDRVTSPLFDDEDEWTVTAPQTQVAKLDEQEAQTAAEKTSTPPTSRLVARLFPKLNNANQIKQAQKIEQEQQKLQAAAKLPVGDGIQSKLLRDKLAELEKEIEKFRNENANLDKLRKDREELLVKLKQEISEFEKEKDMEVRRLEEFRTQEMKKLKQERKLFEQYQKTVRAMPDKREREEIENLKHQLSELQEEMKKKEMRWTSSNNRLRQRLEVVEMENKELKEELKLLEKRRLEMMQRESQKKNGVQKTFPRSSTPTEEENGLRSADFKSHPTVLKQDVPSQKNVVQQSISNRSLPNGVISKPSIHSQSLLRPDAIQGHSQGHNVSGDAIPRGQPAPSSLPSSDNQSPEDDTNSVGAVVNLPRKQSAKFSSENPSIEKGDGEYEETQYPDGKVERTYTNGAREILFANGTRKEISSDGQSIVVSFFNGDIKQIFPDQRVVYYYADAQTTHTTYPDGLEILQFQNKQIEKHYPDGTKEITFPDQTIKYLFPNGSEESIFPDGTVIRVEKNGDKTMEFPNGQREIHTEAFKRREYPDGTVKTVYPDGRQETRYSTGRIRLKDKDGNVIVDRMC